MTTPVTLIEAIEAVLRPSMICHGNIVLEEIEESSTCLPISLTKSGQAVVVRPDADGRVPCPVCQNKPKGTVNDRIFGLFNAHIPDLTGMCDYIIFYQDSSGPKGDLLFVFLCELKSRKTEGAYKQAENGKLLAEHILNMARHHRPSSQPHDVIYRGLIFGTKYKLIPKGRLTDSSCAYQPSSKKIPRMGFAYLPCGGRYPLRYFCA